MTVLISYRNNNGQQTTNGKRQTAKSLLTLVFCCFALVVSGQTTGYQGKRMMFKMDMVSPLSERGINVGLEYVILRNVVLGLDFSLTGRQYIQRFDIDGESSQVIASIRDVQAGIIGQYFLNGALPAPKGSYIFGKYYLGQADIFAVDRTMDGGQQILQGFEIKDVPSSQFDIGVGHQEVFFGFLLVDFDFGMSAASLFLNKSKDETLARHKDIVADFAASHGPNIASMGSWRNVPGGIGLSIHLKVGILLF